MENIKSVAWNYLLECEINSLPIDILSLQNKGLGYKIMTYSKGKSLLECINLMDYSKTHKGFSINITGNEIIFYDTSLSFSERMLVIAHEIGYIVLKHTSENSIIGKCKDKAIENRQEKEAEVFANAFLAPTPVLLKMNIKTASGISRITWVPIFRARAIAKEVEKEESTQWCGIETKLVKYFSVFIKNNTEKEEIRETKTMGEKKEEQISIQLSRKSLSDKTFIMTSSIVGILLLISVLVLLLKNSSPVVPTPTPVINVTQNNHNNTLSNGSTPSTNEPIADTNEPIVEINEPIVESETLNKDISENIVYITKTGKKYHLQSCRYVEGKTNILSLPVKEAESKGLNPCSICQPELKKTV